MTSSDHLSGDDYSTDEEEVSRDFEAEARLIIDQETLPKKSADRYKLVYEAFQKWKVENKASSSDESVLIIYFQDLKKKLKPTTLWSVWSMLKKTLNAKDSIDIDKFLNLKSLLKNNAKGYKPTKSFVLDWNQIMKFMNNAPDLIYLALKVRTQYLCYA